MSENLVTFDLLNVDNVIGYKRLVGQAALHVQMERDARIAGKDTAGWQRDANTMRFAAALVLEEALPTVDKDVIRQRVDSDVEATVQRRADASARAQSKY